MSKRITIVFNDELLKKLRHIHYQRTATSTKSISFSSIVAEILQGGLK